MTKKLKLSLIVVFAGLISVGLIIFALVYFRTGSHLYSHKNLAECQNFSTIEAKEAVLRVRLNKPEGWLSYATADRAAKNAGIIFFDSDITKTDENWLIPFYQKNQEVISKYYAMLDCGTQTVEYAAEKAQPD